MENSVVPDQMLHSAASDLGLHCFQRPSCPNTLGYYGNDEFRFNDTSTHEGHLCQGEQLRCLNMQVNWVFTYFLEHKRYFGIGFPFLIAL